MRIALAFLFLLLPVSCCADILITEIMYRPEKCTHHDCEWIELYNNGNQTIDLSNWTIDDNDFDDINISSGEYVVIAYELVDMDGDNESFECVWGNCDGVWNSSDGNYTATDGFFRLANNYDTIILKNSSGGIVQNISYNSSMGADGNGESLQLINGSWQACAPTPGKPNACNATYNASNCDLVPTIQTDKLIFESGDSINYKLKVQDLNCQQQKHNYSIEYWIINLFGDYLRKPHTSTYSMTCSDTSSHTKKAPEICGSMAYYIQARIIEPGCNESNSTNNFAEQLVIVKGQNPSTCQSSESIEEAAKISASELKELDVEILSAPTSAAQGEFITILARVTNNQKQSCTIQIYSYIYSGRKLASEGGWTANRQTVELNPRQTKELNLQNKIKSSAESGLYKLKVRAKLNEKKFDAVSQIEIFEAEKLTEKKSPQPPKPLLEQQPEICPQPPSSNITDLVVTQTSNLSTPTALYITGLLLLFTCLAISIYGKTFKPKD